MLHKSFQFLNTYIFSVFFFISILQSQTLNHTSGTDTYNNNWNTSSNLTILGGEATFNGTVRSNSVVNSLGGIAIFNGPLQNNVLFNVDGGFLSVNSIQNNAKFNIISGEIEFNAPIGNKANIDMSGGTLLLNNANVFNNSTSLTFSGGTIETQGNNLVLGSLTLTGDSVIDLGNDPNSYIELGNISGTGDLTITNWTDSSQLNFTNIAPNVDVGNQIVFSPNIPGTVIGGQIVPITVVPEPGTIFSGILLVLFAVFFSYKQYRAKKKLVS